MESNPIPLNVPLPHFLEEVDGEYRLKGHRISLFNVITANRNGIAPHAMVFYYGSLSLYEIRQVFEFYEANREAVNDFVDRYQAALDRQRAAGKQLDLEKVRRRYEEKRAAAAAAQANGRAGHAAAPAAPAGVP